MATRVHGISDQDVACAPAFTDVKQEVRRVLEGRVLVAHNAHVDVSVLRRELGCWECPEVFDAQAREAIRAWPAQLQARVTGQGAVAG